MKVGKCKYLAEFQRIYNVWKIANSPLKDKCKPQIFTEGNASELEDTIKGLFKLIGRKAWKINVQGTPRDIGGRTVFTATKSDKGVSDIITLENGLFIAIEVKVGRDTQSERQAKFERDVKANGGKYFIVKNFEHFLIQAHGHLNLFGWRGTLLIMPLYGMLMAHDKLNVNNSKEAP